MSIKPEELKPCPFCGRNLDMTDGDTLHPNGVGWTQQGDYRNYDRAIGLPKSQWCYVACCSEASGGCGAEMSGDSRQEARELKAQQLPDMRDQIEVVKVRIHLEVTGRDSGEYQIGIGRTGSGASPQSDSSSFQARSEVDTIGQNSR